MKQRKSDSEATRRAKLLQFLKSDTPVRPNLAYSDFPEDAAKWVRKIRQESDRIRGKKNRRD